MAPRPDTHAWISFFDHRRGGVVLMEVTTREEVAIARAPYWTADLSGAVQVPTEALADFAHRVAAVRDAWNEGPDSEAWRRAVCP